MSRTTRLFELMQVLRRHRRAVSGRTLAEELGVSLRTLYRDIAELKALGAEIDGAPGTGYMLRPGFLLPPLMFTEDEVEALALGLRWVRRRADDDVLAGAAGEVLAKLSAVLPEEQRHQLDDSALLVGPGWGKPQVVPLETLRRAIREQCRLEIDYGDGKGQRSSRVIWPFAIGFFESTRIVVAWCELRQDFRHFRADRILEARVLDQRYPRRRHELHRDWSRTLLTKSVSTLDYPATVTPNAERTPMDTPLVFYTHPLSRSGIVHWMLEELGVPYEMQVIEYGEPMKSPEYLAINPMGKVPALRHGEVVVTEAAAICAYLADAFPEAGLAPEPRDRGDYYRWLFFAAGPLEAAVSLRGCDFQPTLEQEARLGFGSYERTIEALSTAIKGKRYIAGDAFSAADVYVGSHLRWGMLMGAIDKRPEFEAYCAGLAERPAQHRSLEFIEQAQKERGWAP